MKRSTVLVWSVASIAFGVAVAQLVFAGLNIGASTDPGVSVSRGISGLLAVLPVMACSGVGTLVLLRRPTHPIGWVLQLTGIGLGTTELATGYATRGLLTFPGSLTGQDIAAWLSQWLWAPPAISGVTVLLFLFPDGKLLSRRWRYPLWMGIVAGFALALFSALDPGPLGDDEFRGVINPFGAEHFTAIVNVFGVIGFVLAPIGFFCGVGVLVIRFRRSRGVEREQLKWIAYVALLSATVFAARFTFFNDRTTIGNQIEIDFLVLLFISTGLPVAAGFAILRYRLYDIDVIIKRSLVYGPLTAILAGVFAAVNIVAQKAFVAATGQESDTATAVTALVVVALFTPLKSRIQSVVDRRLKEAPDAAKKMREYAEQVRSFVEMHEAEQIADRYLDSAATAFQAGSGALYLYENGVPVLAGTRGKIDGPEALRVPLVDRGTEIGYLLLGPRRNDREYLPAEREALTQGASALAAALRLSRRAI